jgi:hypothetical protein|tara:strand:- start:206 stop:856 length:651 start_codon:yes stop_codon:yes gene_type:complete
MIEYIDTCKSLVSELDPFTFQLIKKDISNIRKEINSDELVGDVLVNFHRSVNEQIKFHTLPNSRSAIERTVLQLIELHEQRYNYLSRMYNFTTTIPANIPAYEFERVWVNFQRPGGFVPLHQHSGLYSFVIWCDIPYTLSNQSNEFSDDHRVGTFEFVYTDCLGKLSSHVLPADKTWEGRIAVFPAELHHQVYPFYDSNDFRVTISGNLKLNAKST